MQFCLSFLVAALVVAVPTRIPSAKERMAEAIYAGRDAIPMEAISWARDWAERRVLHADLDQAVPCIADPADCRPGWSRWGTIMTRARQLTPMEQLELVNAYWNRVPYRDAIRRGWIRLTTLHEAITWSAPFDCDDIAVAKLMTLQVLGWKVEDLRLVAVQEIGQRRLHAVATARLGTEVIVLDSAMGIRDGTYMDQFRRVYWSFDFSRFYPQGDVDEVFGSVAGTGPDKEGGNS